jgi:hypothetical protein
MPPANEDAAFVRVRDFVLGAIVRSGRHERRDGQREEEEGGGVHGHAVVSRGDDEM